MPKIHPREKIVREAEAGIRLAVEKHTKDLTLFERMKVITQVLSNEIGGDCKYQIRYERHGDYETPGGLE